MTVQFIKSGVFPQGLAPAEEAEALKVVEICGRTAYKSEDRITEDSARSFVLTLKKLGHLSVLEHSNIALRVAADPARPVASGAGAGQAMWRELLVRLGERNGFHRIFPLSGGAGDEFAIAGNFRSWVETVAFLQTAHPGYHQFFSTHLQRFYPSLFAAPASPTDQWPQRVSLLNAEQQLAILRQDPASDLPVFVFKFICDRGITHEVVRHRVFSFTQESTRYVNYQDRGMTLILPEELHPFYDFERGAFREHNPLVGTWLSRAITLFEWYQEDLRRGLKPEIARDILPNLLKSEIFVSGRWSGWKHFIELRDSKKAHPRIRAAAREVREYFDALNLRAVSEELKHQ
jgi:flavin-dependent thymidylate synthase